MPETVASFVRQRLPHFTEIVGARAVEGREEEFARLKMALLWQVDRDLALLRRRLRGEEIRRAYRDLLGNPGRLIDALYEIRVAAMLAPVADSMVLGPPVGAGRADLKCVLRGHSVFLEVTTHTDDFPPTYDGQLYTRATVERSFDPSGRAPGPDSRDVPVSKEFRDRIVGELRQLPRGGLTGIVLGAPRSRSADVEAALAGDERLAWTRDRGFSTERVPNGIFTVPDEVGGASRLGVLIWMRLVPHFSDIRIYSRVFPNRGAACPLPDAVEELFVEIFDRRTILDRELKRITTILVDRYRPERIVLFGSLGAARRTGGDTVHEGSDIDLAIVKASSLRFIDRIGEVMDLVQPRVAVNLFVYTPEEFARAQGVPFVRDEIVDRGWTLFP